MAFSIQVITDGVILAGAFKLTILTKKPNRTFCQTTYRDDIHPSIKCNTILLCLNYSIATTQMKMVKRSQSRMHKKLTLYLLSKETVHCVNVIRQICASFFFYLSRSALLGIPHDNGIFRSRDRIGRYGRSISADNPRQKFRLDKLKRKNNKLSIYSVITALVPYCKLGAIAPNRKGKQSGKKMNTL